MADEYQDNYGTYVFNNYTRNCELAKASATHDEAKADILRNAATSNMRRNVSSQRPRNTYSQSASLWAKKWPNLNDQSDYLSLDSDSDSDSCCGSSTSCTCSKCCESTCCSSNKSSSFYTSELCGCHCDCQLIEDRQHRRSRRHHVREKRMIATSQPSKSQGGNTMSSERYHKCKTPHESTSRFKRNRSTNRNGLYQGVIPELRPGPYGNKFFTEEDVYRKYFRDSSATRAHPEPDLILYPID
ncbi:unnamed protein product [Rodentolepis nana]|uniref:Uncharacterized protein n=1 Tax=Rodentolepis nana TaxID=102285 RepID=A0A0R3T0P0_RODNA|nr:unnamed protein product [Rodentolepis nana]